MRRYLIVLLFVLLLIAIGGSWLSKSNGLSPSLRKEQTIPLTSSVIFWRNFVFAASMTSYRQSLLPHPVSVATITTVPATTVPSVASSTSTTSSVTTPQPVTTSTVPLANQSLTVTTTQSTPESVSATVYAEWKRVNVCENGGDWMPIGSAYPDGLGISEVNWWHYGGTLDLSPDAQILVAEAIETANGTPGYVPDQGYCAAW